MSRERDWLPTSAANHFQRLFAKAAELVAPQRLGRCDAVIRLRYLDARTRVQSPARGQ
jgi:hypothetical protein